jgi:hypothetical protein
VVGADDAAAGELAGFLLAENRAAVPAGVVERLQAAFSVLQDNNILRADRNAQPVTRRGDLLRAAGRNPAAEPERLQLALVMRRIVVPGRRQPGFEALERFPCHAGRVKL